MRTRLRFGFMSLPRAESYTSHLQKIICLAAIFQAADLCLPGNLKQCWSSIAAGKKENGSRKRQQKQPDVRYIGMEFSQTSDFEVTMKGSRSFCFGSPLAQRVGFEPTCGCPQTDFESLEAGVFWSILSASLRPSERRKPLILLEFPAFLLSAQGFGNFFRQSRFSGKV